MKHLGFGFFALLTLPVAAGEPVNLLDEKMSKWTTPAGKPVAKGWTVVDGVLQLKAKSRGGQIVTGELFGDFDLRFEFKLAAKANSGIKYRVKLYGKRPLGLEYQLIDDARFKNKPGKTSCGSLYALYAPKKKRKLNPPGQWNSGRITVVGDRIAHYLNGEKILEADASSEDWAARIKKSKFNKTKGFAKNRRGKLLLQDHGGGVWIRNMTVR